MHPPTIGGVGICFPVVQLAVRPLTPVVHDIISFLVQEFDETCKKYFKWVRTAGKVSRSWLHQCLQMS